MKNRNKNKTKSVSLIVKTPLNWGGVMSTDPKALQVRDFCIKVAKVYGVPPMCVNALANQPYLNKEGRLFLLHNLRKVKAIRTEFLQMSKTPGETAICKKTIVLKDGTEIEGIGEASPGNVKLEAVQKTLNMMAETRALNRAIWQEISADVWKRVEINLNKIHLTEEEKDKAAKAGTTSYEEVNAETKPTGKEMSVEEKHQKALAMIAAIKTKKGLTETMNRVQKSKLYSAEQKETLVNALMARAAELDK